MKSTELKKMIKEAVKEAIQDELKEILLEAVRTPRGSNFSVVQESSTPPTTQPSNPSTFTSGETKTAYQSILSDMSAGLTTNNMPKPFTPGGDSVNGALPEGEVNMAQIAGFLGK
tara:strand:- start:381 stop:725 length:345 start_codon:yes stop_codon:yes gene_type:complete